ncbi:GNAT family N-acetyltransferase [Photobacterium sp. OFAV2-7]|uniref:GNAT family N-acetyltransferase n=1 Tax=Photobacterium sp. OFAV2-7 TaxID=2917748 RepID=UPI001EF44D69|nr:GNAT family N-acetyltransferase [Photobacterium sp. OFAV2-7]MCG7585703.1 N-acetyltransferase family protein [Photobacterium sp. OFAV2-7]
MLFKDMKFISCNFDSHANEILTILNDAIINSTALYDYKPRTMDNMVSWFNTKEKADYPVIGAIDEHGQLMGFASYGRFREQPAFKYTVEHSVYLHPDFRGRGVGKALMKELIERARQQHYHVIIGAIDLENEGSIYLHQKLGFTHSGTIHQAGFKFGRWLDLGFYQLVLNTPASPVDG